MPICNKIQSTVVRLKHPEVGILFFGQSSIDDVIIFVTFFIRDLKLMYVSNLSHIACFISKL